MGVLKTRHTLSIEGDVMNNLDFQINYLLSERKDAAGFRIPDDNADKFRLYRSLVNIRPAVKADDSFLQAEDEYLTTLTESKGITDIADLTPTEDSIYLPRAVTGSPESSATGSTTISAATRIRSCGLRI